MMNHLCQRQPREECPAFLAFVRRKACCVCGAPAPSHAAHIRMASPMFDKRSTGMAEKPSDRWCVALCRGCHLDDPGAQHRIGEEAFWKAAGLNPFVIATTRWAQFCRHRSRTPEQHERLVKRATSVKRAKVRREKRKSTISQPVSRFTSAVNISRPKMKSASAWPPKGSRKLQGRGFQ